MGDSSYRTRLRSQYADRRELSAEADEALQSRYSRWMQWWLRGWLPEDPSARCLDAGCGQGRFLRFLQAQGYTELTGVDVSPEQVEIARRACDNVEVADATEFLRRSDARFDLIAAIDVIEHFTRDEAIDLCEAAWEALTPGGRLILQTPNGTRPGGVGLLHSDLCHEMCLTPVSARRLLKHCGFVDFSVREMPPVPLGARSTVRWFLYHVLRLGWVIGELVETGGVSDAVFSRVMLVSARAPSDHR